MDEGEQRPTIWDDTRMRRLQRSRSDPSGQNIYFWMRDSAQKFLFDTFTTESPFIKQTVLSSAAASS